MFMTLNKLNGVIKSGIFCVLFGLMAALGCSPTHQQFFSNVQREEKSSSSSNGLIVLFSGSTFGEFEPCGCGGVYDGGLSRRSSIVEQVKRVNPNVLLVDTGDMTGSGSATQFEFMSQGYSCLKYDAIALGEGELRVGVETFSRYVKKYSLPIVCSNIRFKKDAANPSETDDTIHEIITVEKGGKRIVVISVMAERWFDTIPESVRNHFEFEKPVNALSRLLPTLKDKDNVDSVVLLSHLSAGERDAIRSSLDGVDLWIDNDGHRWMLGRANSNRNRNTTFELNGNPPLLTTWQNDRKIGIADAQWNGRTLEVIKADFIPIVRSVIQDKKFLEIYDAYKYSSRQEMIKKLMGTKDSSASQSPQTSFPYVNSEKCSACHKEIYDFWKKSHHSRAYETIVRRNCEADMNCWPCHTTGHRESGGFVDPAQTPDLKNVGCQSCHKKDLRLHPPKEVTGDKASKIREKAKTDLTQSWHCQRCHVPHRSPKYEYFTFKRKISCKQALDK
jgi:hypothetical protein